jgi:hypothetical protein
MPFSERFLYVLIMSNLGNFLRFVRHCGVRKTLSDFNLADRTLKKLALETMAIRSEFSDF